MRIAVLDDEPAELAFVTAALSPAGYGCHVFTRGRALVHRLQRESFDLLTLDWNVADMPGDAVLAWVRASCHAALPVLFMTNRSHEADIVQALNAGADDYIVKPIAASVLLARVTNLLRRTNREQIITTSQEFGEYAFDLQKGQAFCQRQPVPQSQKEFQLALLLFRNIGRPLSRAHLVETVWKQTPDIPTRTLDTHLSAVRVKLNLRPQNGYRIIPIYGFGYRLERLDADRANSPTAITVEQVHRVTRTNRPRSRAGRTEYEQLSLACTGPK